MYSKQTLLSKGLFTLEGGFQMGEYLSEDGSQDILSWARDIQQQFHGPVMELCSIVNAKSGACPHNCSFCAQSRHSLSPIDVYPLREPTVLLEAARTAERIGAHRFSIVTSGAMLTQEEFRKVREAVCLIREGTNLLPCASLGKINFEQALGLKEAGLVRYHHNLETNRDFYPRICTTQAYEDRLSTILTAREAGLEICVGGILGLGESWEDRVRFALEIRQLKPNSVPLNFLDPRPGTPMESKQLLTPKEAILAVALFRVLLPDVPLRLAGGRAKVLGDSQGEAIRTGINGLMIGDLLTTTGAGVQADWELIATLHLKPSIL